MSSHQVQDCLWQEGNPNPIISDPIRPRRTLETTRALLQDPNFLASADHPPAAHPNAKNVYGSTHDTFNNFYHGPNPSPFKPRKKKGKGRLTEVWAKNVDHVAMTLVEEGSGTDDETNKLANKHFNGRFNGVPPNGLSGWLQQHKANHDFYSGDEGGSTTAPMQEANPQHNSFPKMPKKRRPIGSLNPNFTPRINPMIWEGKGRLMSPYRAKNGCFGGSGNNVKRKYNAAWNNYTRPGIISDLKNQSEANDFDIQVSVAPRPRHFLVAGTGQPLSAPAAVYGLGKSPRVLSYPPHSSEDTKGQLDHVQDMAVGDDYNEHSPRIATTSGNYGSANVANQIVPKPPKMPKQEVGALQVAPSSPTFGKPSATMEVGGIVPPPRSFVIQSQKALRERQNQAQFKQHLESVAKFEAKNRIPIRVPLLEGDASDTTTTNLDNKSPRMTHTDKLVETLETMQQNVVVSATGRVYTLPTKHSRIFATLGEDVVGVAGAINSAATAQQKALSTTQSNSPRQAITSGTSQDVDVDKTTPRQHYNHNYPSLSGYHHAPIAQAPPAKVTASRNVATTMSQPPLIIVEAHKNAALLEHLRSPRADHGYRGSHHINRRPDEALLIQKHYPLYVQSITKGPQSLLDPKPGLPAVPKAPKYSPRDREQQAEQERKEFERAVRKERERREAEEAGGKEINSTTLSIPPTIAIPKPPRATARPATAALPNRTAALPITREWLEQNSPYSQGGENNQKSTPPKRRVMSADVKRRIQELADRFLGPEKEEKLKPTE